jgi:hypothetical protein
VDWQTWAPGYSNLTVGNGTVTARYTQIGKLVVANYALVLGSTSTIGTSPLISIPVTAAATFPDDNAFGVAMFRDITGSRHTGMVDISTSDFTLYAQTATGATTTTASLTSTVPFTWATGDTLQFSASYEAA